MKSLFLVSFLLLSLQALNLNFDGLNKIKTMEPIKIDGIKEMDLRLFKSVKPCYFYGNSITFLEKQRDDFKNSLLPIGAKKDKGEEVVNYIEFKFQAKGFLYLKPKITKQEIIKKEVLKQTTCDFDTQDKIFENSKNLYKNLKGELYYIKLIK